MLISYPKSRIVHLKIKPMNKPIKITWLIIALFGLILATQSCSQYDPPEPFVDTTKFKTDVLSIVSESEAIDVAANFSYIRNNRRKSLFNRTSSKVEFLNNRLGEPVAYVVNTEGEGWIIVSATRNCFPILAYSDNPISSFSPSANNMHEGIMMWLDDLSPIITGKTIGIDDKTTNLIEAEWELLSSDVAVAQESGIPTGNSPAAVACRARLKSLNETYSQDGWSFTTLTNLTNAALKSHVTSLANQYESPYEYTIVGLKDDPSKIDVGPLIHTKWHQKSPYNALCLNQYPAGCVAIAMAQIMNFHRSPADYDWNDMLDNDATHTCQMLIRDIGQRVKMSYGPYASTANLVDTKAAFEYFSYKVVWEAHDFEDVNAEIGINRRPVFMAGRQPNASIGHVWVCDGVIRNKDASFYYVEYLNTVNEYSNRGETFIYNPGTIGGTLYTQYHMNWGWSDSEPINTVGWYISLDKEYVNFVADRQNLYIQK